MGLLSRAARRALKSGEMFGRRNQREYIDALRASGFDVERPLYHGTGADFDAFDLTRAQSPLHGDSWGGRDRSLGVSLTSEPWNASDYAMASADFGGAPNVRPVFVRGRFKAVRERDLAVEAGEEMSLNEAMARAAERARAEGYSGLAIQSVARGMPTVEYKVFPDADGIFRNVAPRFGQ